jgi:D(-)-tartrate dehydratase
MRITAIRDVLVPIGAPMRNASIAFDRMTASALAIVTDARVDGRPVIGYAFDSIGRYGKSGLLRERFVPRLLSAPPESLCDARGLVDPERCWRVLMANEKDGGHGERSGAVGLLDAALWDARAKAEAKPLWRVLADRYLVVGASGRIPAYASCGHYRAGADTDGLADEVKRARDLGYRTVKIKVGGDSASDDLRRVEIALGAAGPGGRVAVDVNGKLSPGIADPWLEGLASRGVAWIEEPASPLDYAQLAALARTRRVPLATGENLFSFDDARNLLRYGGLDPARDLLQFDMLLAYGVPEYVRIVKLFEEAGWPRARFYPHAGHLFAAHCVAGLALGSAEAAPDASLAYGGYWDGTAVDDGHVRLPNVPGVGYETKANLYAVLAPLGAP